MRVLHATEAMGGGIVTVLQSFEKRQADEHMDVHIFYTRRSDTPDPEDLRQRFSKASLTEFAGSWRILDLLRFTSALWRVFNSDDFDVVHLHSSLAGGVGRVAYALSRRRPRLFYSPHGFSFLRSNKRWFITWATRATERTLARVGDGLVLTCASEQEVARNEIRAQRTFVVQTGVGAEMVGRRKRSTGEQGGIPTVAMIGRPVYQKAPWRFARVARELKGDGQFRWFGANASDSLDWFAQSPVELVGWMSPENLDAELDKVDVLLFPTLWEGMPYSLIMSQARGIPAVVSDVVGNRDGVVHGVTGFVATTDQELIDYTACLLRDAALRERMAEAAVVWAERSLTDSQLGAQSAMIYRGLAVL